MRNRLIHEYFGTDLQLIWEVIRDELPTFETELKIIPHAKVRVSGTNISITIFF
ncbi:hypothetical protein BH11BAC4_BH11BAC4_23970 [soil metagenome]